MPRKIIIITGAPEGHMLDWTPSTLLNYFLEPIARFAHLEVTPAPLQNIPYPSTPGPAAAWRSIPLHRERLRSGFSQTHALARSFRGTPEFFNTLSTSLAAESRLAADESSHSVNDQFYDYSLAIHEDISSSQLPSTGFSLNPDESSMETTGQISTDISESFDDYSQEANKPQLVDFGHLSDLEDLPNAKYLESIQPQTMTVNIIVGVISIAQPRVVQTRWGSKALVELLVGDDTRSGFTITFWLTPEQTAANDLLKTLRRQDILLLRNVALGVFMDKVHGHSLRKGHTKIHLLHRRRTDTNGQGGTYTMRQVASTKPTHPQLAKTRRVWEWLLHFVGDGGTSLGKRGPKGKPTRRWDLPPEDTQ